MLALIDVIGNIYQGLEVTIGVYLDLQKAFDT